MQVEVVGCKGRQPIPTFMREQCAPSRAPRVHQPVETLHLVRVRGRVRGKVRVRVRGRGRGKG